MPSERTVLEIEPSVSSTVRKHNFQAQVEQPLFKGMIEKMTHGYQEDFVPRFLVITSHNIEFYRNEEHSFLNSSCMIPIVKFLIGQISAITMRSQIIDKKKSAKELLLQKYLSKKKGSKIRHLI